MGKFNTHGGYFAPEGYFRINEGGSHEENPNGGVQVGVDQEGTPNMLEEGEPVYNDYVYSDNITAEKDILEKYNIPVKYAGKLYSKIADAFVDEAEDRPNDPISNNGLNAMLVRLADAQEEQKAIAQQKELEEQLANMTPEELDALEAMLAEQEAAEQQAAQEQVMQEQAMAEQQATPEEQTMVAQQMQAQPPVQEVSQQPIMACGGKMRKYAPGGLLTDPPVITARDNTRVNTVPLENYIVDTDYTPNTTERIIAGVNRFFNGPSRPIIGGLGALELLTSPPLRFAKGVNGAKVIAAMDKAYEGAQAVNTGKKASNTVNAVEKISSSVKNRGFWNKAKHTALDPTFQFRRGYAVGRDAGWGKTASVFNGIGRGVLAAPASVGTYSGLTYGGAGLYNYIDSKSAPKIDKNKPKLIYSEYNPDYANGGMLRNYYPEGGLIPGVHNIPSWYKLNPNDGKYYDPEVLAREQAIAQSVNAPAIIAVNRSRGTNGSSNTRNVGNIRSTRMQPIDASIMGGMAYKVNPNAAVAAPDPTGELSSITIQDTVPDYVTWRGIGEQFGMVPNWYRQGWVRRNGPNASDYVSSNGRSGIPGTFLYDFDDNPQTEGTPEYTSGNPALDQTNTPGIASKRNRNQVLLTPVEAPNAITEYNSLLEEYIPNQAELFTEEAENRLANRVNDVASTVVTPNITDTDAGASDTTTTKQTTERPQYPTWMRYAGLANALGDMAWNLAQRPDRYKIPYYNPVLPEGRMHLIDPIFNPIDENIAVNDLLASNAGTVYGLRNSGVGPSLGANILAADYNAGRNIGAARTQIWDANNQRRNQVITQRNQNAQALGQFRYGISRDRANYINQAALQNQHSNLLQQRLNNAAEQEKWNAFNTSKDALASGLSNIGLENMKLNNANDLYDYVRLPDGRMAYVPKMNTAKCGGKMSKKTKK